MSEEKGLNAAFREQVVWFKGSEGMGEICFWALRKGDLEKEVGVRKGKGVVRRVQFLEEAGEEVLGEDGVGVDDENVLREGVWRWREGVAGGKDGFLGLDS